MNEDDLKLCIENVLNTEDGFNFVKHILNETGCFNRSINFDKYKNYYLQGRCSIGEYILELMRKCNFKKYVELQQER